MSTLEIVIISFGLSLDAFAVSICKGLSTEKIKMKHALTCGIYFGLFQGIMPLIGYFLGASFSSYIENLDHWVAFILLGLIGANMIRESFSKEEECLNADYSFKAMLPLAIATSIDALAVGVSFAFLKINIWFSIISIGIITFIVSTIGAKLGAILGEKFKQKAEFTGGVILILIGTKILLEHLGVISF